MDLLKKADDLKKQAEDIIQATNVSQVFGKLGVVEVIGSVRLNTMFRRDIDLLVFSENVGRGLAEKATAQLVESKNFRNVGLADYQTKPGFDMPAGYYWELIFEDKMGESWKFDIWYLRPDEKYSDMVMTAIQRFELAIASSPEKRKLILEIKEKYFDGTKYRDSVKGIDIYTAVIEEGIRSIDEFKPKV
jgi:hypothetical protein